MSRAMKATVLFSLATILIAADGCKSEPTPPEKKCGFAAYGDWVIHFKCEGKKFGQAVVGFMRTYGQARLAAMADGRQGPYVGQGTWVVLHPREPLPIEDGFRAKTGVADMSCGFQRFSETVLFFPCHQDAFGWSLANFQAAHPANLIVGLGGDSNGYWVLVDPGLGRQPKPTTSKPSSAKKPIKPEVEPGETLSPTDGIGGEK